LKAGDVLGIGLFRSRVDKHFDKRIARFYTSVVEDLRIFEDDINGTEAHDIMLHEQGIIPLEALKLILSVYRKNLKPKVFSLFLQRLQSNRIEILSRYARFFAEQDPFSATVSRKILLFESLCNRIHFYFS